MNSEFNQLKEHLDIIREAMRELASNNKETASLEKRIGKSENEISLIFVILKTSAAIIGTIIVTIILPTFYFLLKFFIGTLMLIK